MKVEVSGKQFIFPVKCACCGGTADAELSTSASKATGRRVIRTKTNEWDIPYCDECVRHVNLAEGTASLTIMFCVISVLGAGVLWYFTSITVGIGFGILVLIATSVFYKKFTGQAQKKCTSSCACVTKSIVYLGWHGSTHRFSILSEPYAVEFMNANRQKLVNLSAKARRLLSSTENGSQTNAPRTPRRRES